MRDLAHAIWMKNYDMKMMRPTDNPQLYIMSGLPLSGKTFLAQRIIKRSPADVVYIENDLVREMIIDQLGKEKPEYTPEEHNLVYETSHELIWLALSFSFHAVFDATNLNEKYRQKIYRIADAANAEVLVIKTIISPETAKRRSEIKFKKEDRTNHSPADESIYELLSKEDEPIEKCSRRYVKLELNDEGDDFIDSVINKKGLLLR